MKRLLPVLLLFAFLFSGCSAKKGLSCEDIAVKLLSYAGGGALESGQIFLLGAREGSAEYFSNENKAILYGKKAAEYSFGKIEDAAVFVSSRGVDEIAVFKCYSSSDTGEIARMCLSRADMLKIAFKGTEWAEKAKRIRVSIHKKFVLMVFSDNSLKIEEEFKCLV